MEERNDLGDASRRRDQNWGDAQTRELMHQFAVDIASRADFEICVVEVVRPDGHLEFVAVAGAAPHGEALVGTGSLLTHMRRALSEGTDHGLFTFIRAEDMSPETIATVVDPVAVPDIPAPDDEWSWHPLDMLVAKVRDENADLRALVYLDVPRGLKRPDDSRIEEITEAVGLSMRSVLTVIEHERFAQHVRMMEVVRRLLHSDDNRHDEDALVQRAVAELCNAFDATAFEIHLFGKSWPGPLSRDLDPPARAALAEAAERACAAHEVVIIERGGVWGDTPLREHEPALSDMVVDVGASTVVLAPVGAAGTALGLMLIARGRTGRRWTDAESAAAVDFGHDMGRSIVNARAAHRERELVELLRWHESLRRSFLSTISHELKTPLTVIRANTELLQMDQGLPASAERKLQAIERGVERLVGMVADLTTLAKVTDPTHEFAPVTVDLAALLRDVVLTLEAVASRAGVVLEMEETTGAWCVLGDPGELGSALTNVVGNAVKYSETGGRVRVSLAREGGSVEVTCRDEGLGISEEDQAALFTPFFRSTNPVALARPGSGLGLDIVRRVIERHGGRVVIESDLGHGTTVRLFVPAREGHPR